MFFLPKVGALEALPGLESANFALSIYSAWTMGTSKENSVLWIKENSVLSV